jgi:hypothetical protein
MSSIQVYLSDCQLSQELEHLPLPVAVFTLRHHAMIQVIAPSSSMSPPSSHGIYLNSSLKFSIPASTTSANDNHYFTYYAV